MFTADNELAVGYGHRLSVEGYHYTHTLYSEILPRKSVSLDLNRGNPCIPYSGLFSRGPMFADFAVAIESLKIKRMN